MSTGVLGFSPATEDEAAEGEAEPEGADREGADRERLAPVREPLPTTEEQEALGRWQRLSSWRKAFAIGAFAIGTFGLGFTLGGLVFGRWRKA